METTGRHSSSVVAGPGRGRFRPGQLAWWLPTSAVLGIVIAWIAVVAERYYAPLVVFPVLVGIVLGGVMIAPMRLGQAGHRPTILVGALLAVVLTIVGQHWLAFRAVRQSEEKDPGKAAALRLLAEAQRQSDAETSEPLPELPSTFGEYLPWRAERKGLSIRGTTVRGWLVWLIWAADGLLTAIPAMVLIAATARLPYCDRCRSWYHAMRSGKVEAAAARRLAGLAEVPIAAEIRSARYRLATCQGSCGPTSLALSWEQPDGGFSSGYVWLDASGRNEVLSALDDKKEQ